MLKREMEEVLENDKNELLDLATRVGFLEKPENTALNSESSDVSSEESTPQPRKDVFYRDLIKNNNKPYLERAIETKDVREGKKTQLKPSLKNSLIPALTASRLSADHTSR